MWDSKAIFVLNFSPNVPLMPPIHVSKVGDAIYINRRVLLYHRFTIMVKLYFIYITIMNKIFEFNMYTS